ncbi:MAG: fatty acid desaturase [Bdellovibrionota bacterium]|nr:fatty acid desaturase [Bdellovibrionota bacterium]
MEKSPKKILPYWQDTYSVFMAFLCLFLLVFPLYQDFSLGLSLLWLAVSCLVNFIVNLIDHNHIHVPTFGYRPLNIGFGLFLTLIRGASERFTFIIHNLNHHRYEGSKEDWFWPGNEGKGFLPLRPFIYAFKTGRRFKKEGKDLFSKMNKEFEAIKLAERLILTSFIVFILYTNWAKALIFILVPWVFGNYFIVFTNLIFHKGCDPHSKLGLSKNYTNTLENFLFLNGGYHTIHHLYPRVHWSQLPKMHKLHVEPFINQKYMYNSMVLDSLKVYFNPLRLF